MDNQSQLLMNEIKNDNIVNLSAELKEKISDGRILPEVFKLFIKGLKPAIRDYYDKLDDTLFDMAEKAENNDIQNDYFTAMREVRKKKDLMVRKFSENIQNVFKLFKATEYNYFGKQKKQANQSTEGLSLVHENDLDQELAVSNIVGKANTYLHNYIYAFEKRFALLAGGSEIKSHQIPVSPEVIVNSFTETFVHLNISVTVELIMLKLFERSLIKNLATPYQEINDFLIKEGIYPNLKFKISRQGSYNNQNSTQINQPTNQEPAELMQNMDPNGPAYQQNQQPMNQHGYQVDSNYEAINQAFSQRHAGLPNNVQMPVFDVSVVENALNVLQLEELRNLNVRQQALNPIDIKNELLERLKSLDQNGEKKQIPQQEEDTIDLVGMLFQFLVEDRNLPHRIQALLGKLQIPYLHVALQDRKLFANKENKARKLLDMIAKASVGWTEEGDKKGTFINKIEEIVQSILETEYTDINFSQYIADFQSFTEKNDKRSTILEKRTSAKALGQERILKAKETTAAILKSKMKNHLLPKAVTDILLTPWANVLILAHLRHQDEPKQIEHFIKFVDKLIYVSVKTKKQAATNAQISHVIDLMSKGLRLVAFDEISIKQKSLEIYQLLLEINGIKESAEEVEHEYILPQEAFKAEDKEAEKPEIVHFIANKNINNPDVKVEHLTDEHYLKAKELKTGEWIEFISASDEDNIRAKLSWISPISNKLLFVNARGVKVTDKSVDELAHDLRENLAIVLQQVPIFDRAMQAIAAQMTETDKNKTQKQPEQTESKQ